MLVILLKLMLRRRRLEVLLRGCGLSIEVVDVDEEERVGVWEGGTGGVGEVSAAGVREGVEKDVVGILMESGEVRGEFVDE